MMFSLVQIKFVMHVMKKFGVQFGMNEGTLRELVPRFGTELVASHR